MCLCECTSSMQVTDILTAQMSQFDDAPFDVCTDKGTYDAISLCPEDSCSKRKQYVTSVASLLTDRGIYIITSCNWTGEEIEQQFEPCECGESREKESLSKNECGQHTV